MNSIIHDGAGATKSSRRNLAVKDLSRILSLIENRFQSIRVLVIGDVMLDRYVWGSVDRISPEAPVPVLRSLNTTRVPGGASNVVMNLVGLGARATQAGFWGDDVEQRELAELLGAAGVDVSGMIHSAHPTISKTRVMARRQQLLRMDVENAAERSPAEQNALLERTLQLVPEADAIILSDYAKGTLSPALCRSVIEAARGRGIPVLVDPKDKSFAKYAGATTICPNLSELSMATGIERSNLPELIAAGERLVGETGIDFLTVTMSEKGILLLFPHASFHSQARAREVFDVSGAGDTVIATMALSLAGGLDPESAVNLSNVAAGIVVGKAGTVPVSRNELVAELTTSAVTVSPEKVLENEQLLVRIAEWRATGHRIVFTNGCFDILHIGHITLLEQCRQFGDKLIVAINSDASVQGLKGPTRPVVKQSDRARILAALASTDAVTIFEEETPLGLIRRIRPDVLVKGGDYTTATVVGAEDVMSWGGRVEIVPIVRGHSTSNIVARMNSHSASQPASTK
jgi:D-beta-D-heptose 7-phosphate kinase / D-beta-D-heptose 1-phosphate adenosyltransferase